MCKGTLFYDMTGRARDSKNLYGSSDSWLKLENADSAKDLGD